MTERGAVSRRRVTGGDVAAAAGVSTSIVSLVLNGKDAGRVQTDTRERVLCAARRLGYRIDGRGRSLATGRTGLIGFIAPDSTTPYFAQLQRILLEELRDDYHLLSSVTDVGSGVSAANVDRVLSLGVDGLILVGVDPTRAATFGADCPVLLLDSPGPGHGDLPRINLDVNRSAREVGSLLATLGHRSLAYLDASTRARSMDGRRRALTAAFRAGVLRAGDEGARTALVRCPIDVDAAARTVSEHWQDWRARGVTAIACGSDLQAFGALSALWDLGLSVPQDVSVTGADDQALSAIVRPALTTTRLPIRTLAERAAARMRAMLAGGDDGPEVELLPTETVVRASTGPAPAGGDSRPVGGATPGQSSA